MVSLLRTYPQVERLDVLSEAWQWSEQVIIRINSGHRELAHLVKLRDRQISNFLSGLLFIWMLVRILRLHSTVINHFLRYFLQN